MSRVDVYKRSTTAVIHASSHASHLLLFGCEQCAVETAFSHAVLFLREAVLVCCGAPNGLSLDLVQAGLHLHVHVSCLLQ